MEVKKRTLQQNKALHLFFEQLANELTINGFDMKKTLRDDIDIMWNAYNIKEYLWRPLQEVVCGKKSTTEITTQEINQIFDMLSKAIGERTGLHIPFPSIETLMLNNK